MTRKAGVADHAVWAASCLVLLMSVHTHHIPLNIKVTVCKAMGSITCPLHSPWSKRKEVLKEKRKLGVEGRDENRENETCRKKISVVGKMLAREIGTGHEIKELLLLTPHVFSQTHFWLNMQDCSPLRRQTCNCVRTRWYDWLCRSKGSTAEFFKYHCTC